MDDVKRTPSVLKDCIKKLFHEDWRGDPTSSDNFPIVRWLILEFVRLGFSDQDVLDKMICWGEKVYPNTPPRIIESLQKHVRAILVDPKELGCPRKKSKIGYNSVLSDICFRDAEECYYHKEFNRIQGNLRSLKVSETMYEKFGWPECLFKYNPSHGIYADLIYKIFREWERENQIPPGEKLCIGYREMVKRIQFKRKGVKPYLMVAVRTTRLLEEVGLIKLVEKGKRRGAKAVSQPRANGYKRMIPIPKPSEELLKKLDV